MEESVKLQFKNNINKFVRENIHKYNTQNDKNMVAYNVNGLKETVEALDEFKETNKLHNLDADQEIELESLLLKFESFTRTLGTINHTPEDIVNDTITDMRTSVINDGIVQFAEENGDAFLEQYGTKTEDGRWIYNGNEPPLGSTISINKLTDKIQKLGKAKDSNDAAAANKIRQDYESNHSNEINLILTGNESKLHYTDEFIKSRYTGENEEAGLKLLKSREVARNVHSLVEDTQDFHQYAGANIPTLEEVFEKFPDATKYSKMYTDMIAGLHKQVKQNRTAIDANPAKYADSQLLKNVDEEVWQNMSDKQLEVKHHIVNLDEKPLYFSLGGHPAFSILYSEVERIENRLVWYEQHGVPVEKRHVVSEEFLVNSKADLIEKVTANPENALEEYTALKNMYGQYWQQAFNLYRQDKDTKLPDTFEYLEIFKSHPASEKMLVAAWQAEKIPNSTLMNSLEENDAELDEVMREQFGEVRGAFTSSGAMNIEEYTRFDELVRKLILVEDKQGRSFKEIGEIVYDRMFGEKGDFSLYDTDKSEVLVPRIDGSREYRNIDVINNNLQLLENKSANFASMLKAEENVVIPLQNINRVMGADMFVSSPIPNTFNDQEAALIQMHRNHLNNGTYLITSNGQVTTARIIGLEHNGKEYNVPSYMFGQVQSKDQILNYLNTRQAWNNFPSYNSIQEAEAAVHKMKTIINQDGNHAVIQKEVKNSQTIFVDHYGRSNLATHADGQGVIINMYLDSVDSNQPLVREDGSLLKIDFDDPMDWMIEFTDEFVSGS